MQVETILQSKGHAVFTVEAGAPLSEAVHILNSKKIGAVVVVDAKGKVAGILSERDIVRRLEKDPVALLASPVRNAMTAKVITSSPGASVSDLMETMTQHRIRHIPIVDGGKLTGIVSIGDVVKRKIEETEQEALALKEYIAS
ncbi:MAG: CBS domain-containing protein [Devosia sp.]|uniref:CBS domain-containing protein n=1 Tax=Devosia sp. TaxID=1871048 RepID=UPI001AD0C5F8|nr:CBS domain-containing protein [Devosia sp.]MBN9310788.1 CBS domain-containing protein [Devosia sp.]MBN9316433.1 CBS domain-containing protein [Devosia sp.]